MTDVEVTERASLAAERAITLVDADVHSVILPATLQARLSSRWWRHLADFGPRVPGAYAMFPRMRNGGYRIDARPAEGFAGSDLGLVQAQLLDEYDVDYAVLTPMQPQTFGAEAPGLAEALCRACNDWTREEWLDRDPRLLGSICPPHEHPDLAVAEIERLAGDERFVQVLLPGTSSRAWATAATGRSCARRPTRGSPSRCTPAASPSRRAPAGLPTTWTCTRCSGRAWRARCSR